MSRQTPSRRLAITTKNFQALMGPPWSAADLEEGIIRVHVPTVIIEAASPDVLKTLSAKRKKPAPQVSAEIVELKDSEGHGIPVPTASGSGGKVKVIQTIHSEVIEVLDSDDEGGAAIVIDLT